MSFSVSDGDGRHSHRIGAGKGKRMKPDIDKPTGTGCQCHGKTRETLCGLEVIMWINSVVADAVTYGMQRKCYRGFPVTRSPSG